MASRTEDRTIDENENEEAEEEETEETEELIRRRSRR